MKPFQSFRQLDHHDSHTIRLYENTDTDEYAPHWHSAWEIVLPMEGMYSVIINDMRYDLFPGEILIIPSGTIHELFPPKTPGRRYFLMVDTKVLYALDGFPVMEDAFYPAVHIRMEDGECFLGETMPILYRAIREMQGTDPFRYEAARSLLSFLFIRIGRRLLITRQEEPLHAGASPQMKRQDVMLDACSYISLHCTEPLTLEHVAREFGYSKYHFTRLFKAYTGNGFTDYLLRQRVLICHRLLADPSILITDIAHRSGFGSIATFNRVFLKMEGMSPTAYRQMLQTKQQ